MRTTSWLAHRFMLLLGALLSLTLMGHASAASSYPSMFVFGDSLSDVGNDYILTQRLGLTPAIPPSASPNKAYYQGRFSNGPVAVEYLWWMLSQNAPGSKQALKPALSVTRLSAGQSLDFAFGGAGTGTVTKLSTGLAVPGLLGQVGLFGALQPLSAAARPALYVISAGSNDYLQAPSNGFLAPSIVVGNIIHAIQQLYAIGGRTFLVLNVADLGRLPLVSNSTDAATLSLLSAQHNALLEQALASLPAQLPGARIVPVDIASAIQSLPPGMDLFTPALETLGLPPGVSFCLFINAATCPDVPTFNVDARYFYWDAEHPTTNVHQQLGRYLFNALP